MPIIGLTLPRPEAVPQVPSSVQCGHLRSVYRCYDRICTANAAQSRACKQGTRVKLVAR